MYRAKHITEAVDCPWTMVGERSKGVEAWSQGHVERLEVRMPVWVAKDGWESRPPID